MARVRPIEPGGLEEAYTGSVWPEHVLARTLTGAYARYPIGTRAAGPLNRGVAIPVQVSARLVPAGGLEAAASAL